MGYIAHIGKTTSKAGCGTKHADRGACVFAVCFDVSVWVCSVVSVLVLLLLSWCGVCVHTIRLPFFTPLYPPLYPPLCEPLSTPLSAPPLYTSFSPPLYTSFSPPFFSHRKQPVTGTFTRPSGNHIPLKDRHREPSVDERKAAHAARQEQKKGEKQEGSEKEGPTKRARQVVAMVE